LIVTVSSQPTESGSAANNSWPPAQIARLWQMDGIFGVTSYHGGKGCH